MNSEITIRPVTLADADRLLTIYAPYVLESAITFEYDVPSLQEFKSVSAISPHAILIWLHLQRVK